MPDRRNDHLKILENISLRKLNTFGVDAKARFYIELNSLRDVMNFVTRKSSKYAPYLVLGEGSNILFTKDYPGCIIKIRVKGIDVIHEDSEFVYVRAMAGERWDDVVKYCVDRNYAGIENLSAIPGSAGAAPIQNIGAYGIELSDVLYELEAVNAKTGEIRIFPRVACNFGYRESIFKTALSKQFIILSIILRLRKKPLFNISYGNIKEELEKVPDGELTVNAIREAIVRIRNAKLPDPAIMGNAGSFFKNPFIDHETCLTLKDKYPEMVVYTKPDGFCKLAAGWMIEKCGWKGKRLGDAGVHENQALVLVNHGNATGKEILHLAEEIKFSVLEKFDILLENEVEIL